MVGTVYVAPTPVALPGAEPGLHANSPVTAGDGHARYVRALIDQSRFASGLAEPPEPILTGNPDADSLDVQPHPLESYDELVSPSKPQSTTTPASGRS